MTTTQPAAAPHRMSPVDVLARELYDHLLVLGVARCFEDLCDLAQSRPVLVREALTRLVDIGLVVPANDGCFDLPPTTGSAA